MPIAPKRLLAATLRSLLIFRSYYVLMRPSVFIQEKDVVMRLHPMSFSDRQLFIQTLAQARNLAIECEHGESHASDLRKRCEELCTAIDGVVGELVGDASYLHVKEVQHRA